MSRSIRARLLVFLPAALCCTLAGAQGEAPPTPAPTTFARDVAPVVFTRCAPCHHPGGPGPFSLLSYTDAFKHAEQIGLVTRTRYMPPWLPAPGELRFKGERRLTDDELSTIQAWVAGGCLEGDPAELPPRPVFASGWQLGEPDVTVELKEPYPLRADAPDVIRNFVIPSPVGTPGKWVEAIELHPGGQGFVHHAVLKVDHTRGSRRLDERDPEPGFEGMRMGDAEAPDGHVIVWTPGAAPHPPADGLAWSLGPQDDLVLQLHMIPTGKPEWVKPVIGLHLTDKAPLRQPFDIMLREDHIDIPAGVKDYAIDDSFVLPVPVEVLGIYPHAHYLGRQMHVTAKPPGGPEQVLLHIEHWDFNWQGLYEYAEHLRLPTGTRIAMRFTYDNSADNPRNPNQPPRRVVSGNRSSDEMGNLSLIVLPEDPAQLTFLREAQWRKMVEDDPVSPAGQFNLAVEYAKQGRLDLAATHYAKVLEGDPDDVGAHRALGGIHVRLRQLGPARDQYEHVVRLDPRDAQAHFVLGWILEQSGSLDLAAVQFREALRLDPGMEVARRSLEALASRTARP